MGQVDFPIPRTAYYGLLLSSPRTRQIASMLCLLALALLTVLPAEHRHDADSAGGHGAVIHRHLDDGSVPISEAPADHADHATADHDDHATAHPLSLVCQASAKFAPAPPLLGPASIVLSPDPRVVACVAAGDVLRVHSPPLRLRPSRAPPTHA